MQKSCPASNPDFVFAIAMLIRSKSVTTNIMSG